jgi:arginase
MKKLARAATCYDQPAIAVAGICYDQQSSCMPGAAGAPDRIREAFYAASTNQCCENGLDLANVNCLLDAGNKRPKNGAGWLAEIETFAAELLAKGLKTVFLGGDHAIAYPLVRAHANKYANLTVLHFDAHADLYDTFNGSRYSNACPFARIMEENLARKLIQIGIRTLTPHQREQAARWNVDIYEMTARETFKPPDAGAPIYISLDMDVLDPAFAPGVSHPEPGGFSTRELLDVIQGIDAPIVGADIVEYNPLRDPTGITAMVAAKLLKELIAKMMEFKDGF